MKTLRNVSLVVLGLVFLFTFMPAARADKIGVGAGWGPTVTITFPSPGSDFVLQPNPPGLPLTVSGDNPTHDENDNDAFQLGTLIVRADGYGHVQFAWGVFQHLEHPVGDPLYQGGKGPAFSAGSVNCEDPNQGTYIRIDGLGLGETMEIVWSPESPQYHEGHVDKMYGTVKKVSATKYDFYSSLTHEYEAVPEPATIISSLLGLAGFALRRFRKV